MECKAYVKDISRDIRSNRTNLLIAVEGADLSFIENIRQDIALRLKLVKWHEKRSLDANAYAWVLMSKIAEVVQTSKEEIYEQMLNSYGVIDQDFPPITVIATADMSRIDGHWYRFKTTESKGKTWASYFRIIGSSDYDTKQMSTFIDGIIYEAKNLGIETLPPHEIERMKGEWNEIHHAD